ncbi:hypothetical protein H9P43_006843 [Blastocladiella emersonii ATCC 22665]|nr:hypothetical protein H9P43_006843 [Blastocladiella emersonii ATCC 22665]
MTHGNCVIEKQFNGQPTTSKTNCWIIVHGVPLVSYKADGLVYCEVSNFRFATKPLPLYEPVTIHRAGSLAYDPLTICVIAHKFKITRSAGDHIQLWLVDGEELMISGPMTTYFYDQIAQETEDTAVIIVAAENIQRIAGPAHVVSPVHHGDSEIRVLVTVFLCGRRHCKRSAEEEQSTDADRKLAAKRAHPNDSA